MKRIEKNRKYWKRLAKNFQQGLWTYEGWVENSDSELKKVKEQLEDEIRGRDSDKCKLDAMTNIYRKYRRSTTEWRLSNCVSRIAEILGGVASADDPFLEKYDASSCKDEVRDELRSTKEMLARRDGQLFTCESKQEAKYDELQERRAHKVDTDEPQELEKYKKYFKRALIELRETGDELQKVKDALKQSKEEARVSSKKLNMAEWWSNKAKDNHAKLQKIRCVYDEWQKVVSDHWTPNSYECMLKIARVFRANDDHP